MTAHSSRSPQASSDTTPSCVRGAVVSTAGLARRDALDQPALLEVAQVGCALVVVGEP